jgi:alkanesulfonate monooxygenase SsuD/methylene tetrahydromethanopterin reductase-like flavin-dependent oxidoreductase (luciferase family)
MTMKYGLLLPHFGEHADRQKLLEGSKLAEELGFDSVWVRDHLIFEPHGELEKANREFYDPLTTLTAIGAVTEKIHLGTGSLIPYRHPLQTALVGATMTHLFGPRVIFGMGAGNFDHEFEAVGLGGIFRPDLVHSQAQILREVWTDNDISYADEFYKFENVTIEPKPVGGPIPYWYCGNTPASARRAVEYCDGWMPGRITLATFRKRIQTIEKLSDEQGRKRPTIAVIPPTSVDKDADRAWSYINVKGLLEWAENGPGAKFWVKPESGKFEKVEDLEGSMIAGTPEDAVRECKKFEEAGNEHLVFDFRFKFDQWFEQIELIGKEVLPQLKVDNSA